MDQRRTIKKDHHDHRKAVKAATRNGFRIGDFVDEFLKTFIKQVESRASK